ncbi:MAG: site-specific integrase [Nitrospirota bacterium]|nr:site-specific integrase [Nitrospirota bacterium]
MPRDRAVLETLYTTDARVSELVAMNWVDVQWDKRIVVLHGRKKQSGTHRWVNARSPVGNESPIHD